MATDDRAPKPRKMASEAFQRRLQNEMEQAPPGTLEGFMAAHSGLTPIQFAVAQLSAAEQEVIRQQRPDLCPPRPEAVGLQRRMKTSTECADAVRAAENEATVVT